MELDMVADMEVDKVAVKVADIVAGKKMPALELDMVADIRVDKVAAN